MRTWGRRAWASPLHRTRAGSGLARRAEALAGEGDGCKEPKGRRGGGCRGTRIASCGGRELGCTERHWKPGGGGGSDLEGLGPEPAPGCLFSIPVPDLHHNPHTPAPALQYLPMGAGRLQEVEGRTSVGTGGGGGGNVQGFF
jgi:hypothetical protein